MRFSLGDTSVTLAAGLAASLLLVQFFLDLNAISAPSNEPILGTIVFKKQTATRKAADSQVWERLQDHSPVYAADTLRTSDGSEAVVEFEDGLSLSLLANTMVRLMRGTSTTLDFREGAISVHGSEAARGSMVLGDTGRTLTLSPDAQLVVSKTADTLSLELSQGTASVAGPGPAQALSASTALDLDVKTGAATPRTVELIPRNPVQAARFLSLTSEPVSLAFEYQASASFQASSRVQVSRKADFSSVEAEAPGQKEDGSDSLFQADLNLVPGLWYWRVVAEGEVSSVRQLTLGQEAIPTLVEPVEGAVFPFRTKVPSVRFAWSPREHVTSWVLEVSPEGGGGAPTVRRKTNLTSLSLDLEPGAWSWRVVPQYSDTLTTPAPLPEVRHFAFVSQPEPEIIEPLVPGEGTVVSIQEMKTKGLSFSWKPVLDAQSYELTAWSARQSTARLLGRFTSEQPYRVLAPREWSAEVGPTFWSLRWKDAEGHWSPPGAWRTVVVANPPSVRPLFPPSGYRIADRFLSQTRFRWKAPGVPTTFQVSRTRDFVDVLFETPAQETVLGNRDWGWGTFYWRVTSPQPGTEPFRTDPWRFEVVPPFPAVSLDPPPAADGPVLDQHDSDITWPPTPGAEGYRVSLFGTNEAGSTGTLPLFQVEVDQGPRLRVTLPLSRLPEGAYMVRVQAFAREGELGTSVTGVSGEHPFRFHRLFPLQLQSPVDGETIPGLTARRGVSFEWATTTPPPNVVLEIKNPRGDLVSRWEPTTSPWLVSLAPGDYLWTVRGGMEGLDLTARVSRFTVQEVPLLPPPALQNPVDVTLGPAELRPVKTLGFSWSPVEGAAVYRFRVYRESAETPLWEAPVTQPQVQLPKTLFRPGTYHWDVEAQTLSPEGTVEQNGEPVQARFSIELPVLGTPLVPEERKVYVR